MSAAMGRAAGWVVLLLWNDPASPWAAGVLMATLGLSGSAFVLGYGTAQEAARAGASCAAVGAVNLGLFLGPGILQPLAGLAVDHGGSASYCVLPMAGAAILGVFATIAVPDRARV